MTADDDECENEHNIKEFFTDDNMKNWLKIRTISSRTELANYFNVYLFVYIYDNVNMVVIISRPTLPRNLFIHALPAKGHRHKKYKLFGPPRSGIGTYEFTLVRPFVRPFVISRSQNAFIGLFWFLAQSCSIISIRK